MPALDLEYSFPPFTSPTDQLDSFFGSWATRPALGAFESHPDFRRPIHRPALDPFPQPAPPTALSRNSTVQSVFYTSEFAEEDDELRFEAMDVDQEDDSEMQDYQGSSGSLTPTASLASVRSLTSAHSFITIKSLTSSRSFISLSRTASSATYGSAAEVEDDGPVTPEEEAESMQFLQEFKAFEAERKKQAGAPRPAPLKTVQVTTKKGRVLASERWLMVPIVNDEDNMKETEDVPTSRLRARRYDVYKNALAARRSKDKQPESISSPLPHSRRARNNTASSAGTEDLAVRSASTPPSPQDGFQSESPQDVLDLDMFSVSAPLSSLPTKDQEPLKLMQVQTKTGYIPASERWIYVPVTQGEEEEVPISAQRRTRSAATKTMDQSTLSIPVNQGVSAPPRMEDSRSRSAAPSSRRNVDGAMPFESISAPLPASEPKKKTAGQFWAGARWSYATVPYKEFHEDPVVSVSEPRRTRLSAARRSDTSERVAESLKKAEKKRGKQSVSAPVRRSRRGAKLSTSASQ